MLIAEGSTPQDREGENWGLSFLIGKDTLFDTFGKPERFMSNVRRFTVDIAQIRHIVISHDDWDHVSGLWDILALNRQCTVYVPPHAAPEIKDRITHFGAVVSEHHSGKEIAPGIFISEELRAESDGRVIYEQAAYLRTEKGIVVVCGCAHPGVVTIVEQVRTMAGMVPYAVVGGFHLKNTGHEKIHTLVDTLKKNGIDTICPLHCTGADAVQVIGEVYKEKCFSLREGQCVEL